MSALGSPFLVDGRDVMLTVSIGIAVGSAGVTQPEGLLGSADAAMYRAKAAGRARIEWTVQTA
jgi:PleD family two-component response regulator